jgi:hypothetical protein
MSLVDLSMKELLALHNQLAAKPAGPKTFSTKAKLLDRVRALQAAQVATKQKPSAKPKAAPKKSAAKTGRGVGALARELLLDPRGYPHALIAAVVSNEIEGAACTANSVRWYANEMRKKGVEVPERARVFPAEMNERQSAEWLRSVRLLKRGEAAEEETASK